MKHQIRFATLLLAGAALAVAAEPVFVSGLSGAQGLVVLPDGSVVNDSVGPNVFAPWMVSKYSAAGARLASFSSDEAMGSHFDYDPASGFIWRLDTSGQIWLVNPTTLAHTRHINLANLSFDTTHMWDVNLETYSNFFGILNIRRSAWGDIALLRRGTQLDVFLAGKVMDGEFPFVARLRFQGTAAPKGEILLISSTWYEYNLTPRGIAVSPQGMVLAPLPTERDNALYDGVIIDYPFLFPADFRTGVDRPTQALTGYGQPFLTGDGTLGGWGYTADKYGNFYVAANHGSALVYCPDRNYTSAALRISPDGKRVACVGGIEDLNSEAFEIAVNPAADTVYLSVDQVLDPDMSGTLRKARILKFGQSGANCSYTLTPATFSHGSGRESQTISVTTQTGCPWTPSTTSNWVHLGSTVTVKGSGALPYSIDANTTTARREAVISVAGQSYRLSQAGLPCSYTISPASATIAAAGGAGTVAVTTTAGCAWTATSNATWASITAGASGTGSGSVRYSVAANTATSARSATLTVGGKSVSLSQAAAACSYSISPSSRTHSASAAAASIAVSTGTGCAWTATSPVSWVKITAGASLKGTGTVSYSVAANTATTARSATLQIAGKTFSLTQSGTAPACAVTLTPTSRAHSAYLDAGTIGISAPNGCAWTASTSAAWVSILSLSSGTGNGTLTYMISTNQSGANRTASITISGKAFTITQSK